MVATLTVLVTDPIAQRLAAQFQELAPQHEWIFAADYPVERQRELLAICDVLVCAKLSAQDAALSRAKYVHITGTGTDRVALDRLALTTRVSRTGHHERSIAEHVLMVSLVHSRRLLGVQKELQSGRWRTVATDPSTPMNPTLKDLTFGLVGLGGIGSQVLKLCTRMGSKAIAVRRTIDGAAPEGLSWMKSMDHLPELLSASDVVVLGLPLSADTHGLIGERELACMRPNSLLVNVSRGDIVDEDALYRALSTNQIGGAALDVWREAPQGSQAPESVLKFAQLSNVILTPHNSGHTLDTFVSRAAEITQNIALYANGMCPANLVPIS